MYKDECSKFCATGEKQQVVYSDILACPGSSSRSSLTVRVRSLPPSSSMLCFLWPMSAFLCFSNHAWFVSMNQGRIFRPQCELLLETHYPAHVGLSKYRKRVPSLPSGVWKWLPAILVSPSKDIIRNNGLDAYMTVGLLPTNFSRCPPYVAQYQIRFFKMMIKLMAGDVLITWPILLPINAVEKQGDNKDGLAQLAFGKYITPMYPHTSQIIFIACHSSG